MIVWTNVLSRWMFWTDWGHAAKIERCGMDGTRRSEVIGDEVMWPNSVAVDYQRDRLYWTDAGLHRIETSRLDGSHRKVYIIIIIIIIIIAVKRGMRVCHHLIWRHI